MKRWMVLCLAWNCSLVSCTSLLITKGASLDGSVIVTHSDDNMLSDHRIIYVPSRDYDAGAKRPVFFDDASSGTVLIRYVGTSRGPHYEDTGSPATPPLGSIDQAPHTYAYFDGSYGIINEHQLMIGETSCPAKIEPKPQAGARIFYSAELSRVALERCTTAREAIQLMGSLIDRYGYYGIGEALLVGDKEEGWVMEMCGGTVDGTKGLWVAKKVPDGEVFVSANQFRIREVNPKDPDMLYSQNLFDEAQKQGWWTPNEGALDWAKTVGGAEMYHPYHSLRRIWRVFSLISPSAPLSPWADGAYTKQYPFSIKPDRKISVAEAMHIHRDHYEGTEFDLTRGVAAGPFGCPERYPGPYDKHNPSGAWESPISSHDCGYAYVNQARSQLPDPIGGICWIGLDRPATTCFVPFYVGVLDLPKSYQVGHSLAFDEKSAWWAFNTVGTVSLIKFSYMKEDVWAKQHSLESAEISATPTIDEEALALYRQSPRRGREFLTQTCSESAQRAINTWTQLTKDLLVKYNQGFINKSPNFGEEAGYPQEWLSRTEYSKGPISYKKP